jgi:hypothetical protein
LTHKTRGRKILPDLATGADRRRSTGERAAGMNHWRIGGRHGVFAGPNGAMRESGLLRARALDAD